MSEGDGRPLRVVIGAGTVDTFDFFLPYRIVIENGTRTSARGVIVWHVIGHTPEEPPLEVTILAGATQEFDLRIALETEPKRLAVLLRSAQLSYNAEVTVPTLDALRPVPRFGATSLRPPVVMGAPLARIEQPPPTIEQASPATIDHEPRVVRTAAPAVRDDWPLQVARSTMLFFALLGGVTAGAILLAGAAALRPDVVELAPPSPVVPGASVEVPYRLGGWGRARYQLADARGTIDAGPLAGGAGALRLRLPTAIRGRSLRLAIAMTGPFGSTIRTAAIDVIVPVTGARPAAAAPRIALVAVARSAVRPGDDVHVTYRVEPPSGDVALVDSFGDTLASVPLGPAGQATLRVPPAPAHNDLAVVVRAGSGATAAESRIPLELAPVDALAPAAPDAGPTGGDAGLSVAARRVIGGDQIRVRIDTAYDSLRLELFDPRHRSVSAVALGPGVREAALIAPRVAVASTYTLEATDVQGDAASTSIFPITVTPPAARTP